MHDIEPIPMQVGGVMATLFRLPHPHMVPGIVEPDPDDGVWFVAGGGGFAGFTERPLSYFGRIHADGRMTLFEIPRAGVLPNGIVATRDQVVVTEYLGNHITALDRSELSLKSYPVPTPDSRPTGVCVADGVVYFCENAGNRIGVLREGRVAEHDIPTPGSRPTGIVALGGRGDVVAFSQLYGNRVGVMSAQGEFRDLDLPSPHSRPTHLISDPKTDSLLVCARGANEIVELHCASGRARRLPLPRGAEAPFGVRLTSAGDVWLAAMQSSELIRMSRDGARHERHPIAIPNALPGGLALDTAGGLWTSLHGANALLRIHT